MNRAYVDTSVLTDLLLKDDERAKLALGRYGWTGLPVYAIKEFRFGPLNNWIWFYNKLVINSYTDALRELHRMAFTPKRYTTLTAIEALTQVAKQFEALLTEEVLRNYPGETLDQVIRDQYLLHMKRKIIESWRRRREVTSEVVQEIPCYSERAPSFQTGGLIDSVRLGCDHGGECSLAADLRKRNADLAKILKMLKRLPAKPEHERQIATLKEFLKKKSRIVFGDLQCRRLGDVMFAIFCPGDAVILTTNMKDHEPLAAAVAKRAEPV